MKTTYEVQVLRKYVTNSIWDMVDSFDNQDEATHFFKKYAKSVVGKRFPGTRSKTAKSHLRLVAVTPIKVAI